MKTNNSKRHLEPPAQETSAERRRVGKIVHDDRGNGAIQWVDAGKNHKRDTLGFGDAPFAVNEEQSFNPYEHAPTDRGGNGAKPVKRDLRKLSEWIKTLRAVEANKSRGED